MPTLRNIALKVMYDGTDYAGWQAQPGLKSVQMTVGYNIAMTIKDRIRLKVAGRTDKGVHALGQVVTFKTRFMGDLLELKSTVNKKLPESVEIIEMKEMPESFHARASAKGKTYNYFIGKLLNKNNGVYNTESDFEELNKFIWTYDINKLNIDLMNQTGTQLVGTHNFYGFSGKKADRKQPIRTIWSCEVNKILLNGDKIISISISGRSFMRYMVRIIVKILFEIGSGNLPPDIVKKILSEKKREISVEPAPAKGLVLKKVFYK